jgi:ABC-2 type transport system ATP-binding protein
MPNKITIKNLTKKFGENVALNNISMTFESGKIYGLLGSNGAGKTTLINIISNRVFATAGEVLIDNEHAAENENAQSKIFCVTEKSKYPTDFKVDQLFKWEKIFNEKFDIEYARKLAGRFELPLDKKIKALSTGYTTIHKVITTLASNAPIMIFDEPVLGIDSLFRDTFYDCLLEYHKKNKNLMIIATHLIDEVERVLDNVIIIHKGIIMADCKIADLKLNGRRLNEKYVEILKGGVK